LPSNIIKLRIPSAPSSLPAAFPHGGGLEAAAKSWQCDISEVLDLSTGLHPAGPPAWLGEWLKEHASLVGHYPDSNGEPARSALAKEFSVKSENILITAGAQATIEVIFQAMGWQSMAIQIPCYNEPIRCARRSGCEVRAYETGRPPDADMLWMTSPSNPFGVATDFPQGTRGVLDESYMPFSGRRSLKLVPDVIRIGSLTKTFCIPGLRLGYVIADAAIIAQLNQWLPPWPASTPGQHLLPRLLPEADRRDQQIIISRTRLTALLESFDWQVKPSEASFLMAKPYSGPMPAFSHHRILVRQFPEWPQLAGRVRFGLPGNEAAWQRLEEALCR